MFYDKQGNLRKDLTVEEFNQWKQEWLQEKGCPFFVCSQALNRKVCGATFICGVLFDYKMYKDKPWIKVCDIKLSIGESESTPTSACSACIGSMCLKADSKHDILIGKSFCKSMNDFYETNGLYVDRSLEKYILTWGALLIPIIGEEAYLRIQENPKLMEEIQKKADKEEIFRKNMEYEEKS